MYVYECVYTENEEDYEDLTQALQFIKELIAAVDNKVNEHEKKKKLEEIYNRTDGRTITRMKSGQIFAREDLKRGRKLLHDGPLQLKTIAGRLKGKKKKSSRFLCNSRKNYTFFLKILFNILHVL